MRSRRQLRLVLESLLLACALAMDLGCLSCCHPIAAPEATLIQACHSAPTNCRGHVYVFLMNGLDLLDCSNLAGVCDHLHSLGFIKTYSGQCYHAHWFEKEICRLHHEDPNARFVLVGFDLGAKSMHSLIDHAGKAGATIDLVVYLDGSSKKKVDPAGNVKRSIHIVVDGCFGGVKPSQDEVDVHLAHTSSYGSPTHPCTLETLANELSLVAATVPVEMPAELPADPDTDPTPRPVMPQISTQRDEWDFLKPVASLWNRSDVPTASETKTSDAPTETPNHVTSRKPKPADEKQ